MEIEILDCELINQKSLIAKVNVKLIYSEEKWEIFNRVAYFEKGDKKWVSLPSYKSGDKWYPLYQREPKWPSSDVLTAIVEYLDRL